MERKGIKMKSQREIIERLLIVMNNIDLMDKMIMRILEVEDTCLASFVNDLGKLILDIAEIPEDKSVENEDGFCRDYWYSVLWDEDRSTSNKIDEILSWRKDG